MRREQEARSFTWTRNGIFDIHDRLKIWVLANRCIYNYEWNIEAACETYKTVRRDIKLFEGISRMIVGFFTQHAHPSPPKTRSIGHTMSA